jgi:hypothetical protein
MCFDGFLCARCEVTWHLTHNVDVDIFILIVLVELVDYDTTHAFVGLLACEIHRVEVNVKLELKQKDLLLLANGDAGLSIDGFDFVEPHTHLVFWGLYLYLNEVLTEPLFGKLGIVALLPMPRIFVPN